MGDRFYQQQLNRLGTCPGSKQPKRKRRMAWDDDKKAQAVTMYEEQEPTPETSMEIVKAIAEDLEESPNGVVSVRSRGDRSHVRAFAFSSTNVSDALERIFRNFQVD